MTNAPLNLVAVEAAAKAIFDVRDDEFDLDEWEDLDATRRERYECDARAALSAYRDALPPTLVAEAIDNPGESVHDFVSLPDVYQLIDDLAAAQPQVNAEEEIYTVVVKNTRKSDGYGYFEYPGCTPEIGTLDEARKMQEWLKDGWPERPDSPYASEIGIYKLTQVNDA
ncbi:hypothetical protein [Glutamicibacter sp. TV12E]|uniref:hypothetical protein n=1 Tax=Glutamicibacter sp. TV12E TaxID=3446362 RepID=UPI00403394F1